MVSNIKAGSGVRFLARLLDTIFIGGGGLVVVLAIFSRYHLKSYIQLSEFLYQYEVLALVPIFLLTFLGSVLFILIFLQTPGKMLLGVRCHGSDGQPLGRIRLILREFLVFVFGLGMGILPLLIGSGLFHFVLLVRGKTVIYDRWLKVDVVSLLWGPVRKAMLVFLFLLLAFFSGVFGIEVWTASMGGSEFRSEQHGFMAHFPVYPKEHKTRFYNGELDVDVVSYKSFLSLYEEFYVGLRMYSQAIPEDKFKHLARILMEHQFDSDKFLVVDAKVREDLVFPKYEFVMQNVENNTYLEGFYVFNASKGIYLVYTTYKVKKPLHEAFLNSFEISIQ